MDVPLISSKWLEIIWGRIKKHPMRICWFFLYSINMILGRIFIKFGEEFLRSGKKIDLGKNYPLHMKNYCWRSMPAVILPWRDLSVPWCFSMLFGRIFTPADIVKFEFQTVFSFFSGHWLTSYKKVYCMSKQKLPQAKTAMKYILNA